jgi:hypothetical protein
MATRRKSVKSIESITHVAARRKNIHRRQYQSVMQKEEESPLRLPMSAASSGLEREKDGRNRDLDPQLMWRGKDEEDWSDLVVHAPPLYIRKGKAQGSHRRSAPPDGKDPGAATRIPGRSLRRFQRHPTEAARPNSTSTDANGRTA